MTSLIAMFTFSLSMSISPGPVNMMILSSGAYNGVRNTFSFVSGSTIGFTFLLLFNGLWFSQVIDVYPNLLNYLSFAGSAFMIYIGYLIASSNPEFSLNEVNKLTFSQGFLMQWLNPKAWTACLAGSSLFSAPDSYNVFLLFTSIYCIVCYASLFIWSLLGQKAALILNSGVKLKWFNRIMGGGLIITSCFLFYAQMFH